MHWQDILKEDLEICSADVKMLRELFPTDFLEDDALLLKLPRIPTSARALGLRFYRSEHSCPKGHKKLRKLQGTQGSQCVECRKLDKKAYSKTESARKASAAYQRKSRLENLEKFRARERLWRKQNPAKIKARKIRYRTSLAQATPGWLTSEQWDEMNATYERARRKTEETGILYHVDHIEPIQGKNLCGLHVPWNLRAIPAKLNLSKGVKPVETYLSTNTHTRGDTKT